MKLRYIFTSIFVAIFMLLWMPQIKAQISGHNYTVQCFDNQGNVIVNALYDAVMSDTVQGGGRADPDRVYILLKGGVYWNTEHFQNQGYALRFVGQTPDPNDLYGNPPTLQMVARSDGSVDGHILSGYGDVYMKNIYIIGSDQNGVQTYYQPMEFDGDDLHCVFDSVIFERSNFAITAWTSKNNDIYFYNCKWLNLVEKPITQQWTGRAVSVWADCDSLVFENCTFENVGCFVIQVEGGSAKYFRFVHNTLINVGRQPFQGTWWQTAHIADNLFINPFFEGEGYNDYNPVANPNRTNYYTGIFPMGTLPSKYGPDLGRRIVFANNAAFHAQTFKTTWDDTVRIQPFTNTTADSFFTTYSPANGGQMAIKDTMWLSSMPSFTKYDTSNYSRMIEAIMDLRKGITPAPVWMQDLQTNNQGDTLWTAPQWPLAQNFAYADAPTPDGKTLMTAGTDGLPLGDLNWFPDKLSDWNANKAKYVQQIDNLAGAKSVQIPTGLVEAENGTLSGDAAVQAVEGLTYYDYTGSGHILWTFTAPDAGTYDTRWLVHETGRGQSGPDLAIDNVQFVDRAHGWGQFVFDPDLGPAAGQPNNEWIWVPIVADSVELSGNGGGSFGDPANDLFTFEAGSQHTIGVVKGGWGEVRFAEIDLVVHGGTDTIKLKAPDAETDLVIPGAEGVKWVASGFKYVNMGSNGGVTVDLNSPNDQNYRLNLFYQNTSGTQAIQIQEGGSALLSADLNGNTDGSGLSYLTDKFQLTGGDHQFTISGGNFNLDYVQLIKDSVVAGVLNRNIQPNSYSLSQNYPNPFNPTTNINFSIAKASNVKLIIYNILGQKVATLINNYMSAGTYTYQFNASNLASGVYIYSLDAGSYKMNKKMVLLK
ncbi:MAG: T9SS type A sorting domain-containing protein [Ignavibacteriaceae bacterium]